MMEWLEHNPLINWDKNSKEAREDSFAPPEKPTQSRCIHCDEEFTTDKMIWGTKVGVRAVGPVWWCPTPRCDGAGFGFDVFQVEA